MPNVDFTLEDIGRQTEQIVERIVDKKLDEKFDQKLDQAFATERAHAQLMLDQKLEQAFIKERQHTETMLDQKLEQAFIKEREHTRAIVEAIVTTVVTTQIQSLWEDNLAPAFDEIHQDLKGLHKIVDQHSKDIMELRAYHV